MVNDFLCLEQSSALTLMDRLRVPVVAVDSDGTIGYANDAFIAMLGYRDGAQLTGLPISDITAADHQRAATVEYIDEFSSPAGSSLTWRHKAGHPVSTVVWPVVRLRVFAPLIVMVLTEDHESAVGAAS